MALKRNIRQTYDDRDGEPFATPEDAWIWYSQCQRARDEGARFREGIGAVARPCAPDDIAREVRRLVQRRILGRAHLRVLTLFAGEGGVAEGDRGGADRLWREALDRLEAPLRAKGIVA